MWKRGHNDLISCVSPHALHRFCRLFGTLVAESAGLDQPPGGYRDPDGSHGNGGAEWTRDPAALTSAVALGYTTSSDEDSDTTDGSEEIGTSDSDVAERAAVFRNGGADDSSSESSTSSGADASGSDHTPPPSRLSRSYRPSRDAQPLASMQPPQFVTPGGSGFHPLAQSLPERSAPFLPTRPSAVQRDGPCRRASTWSGLCCQCFRSLRHLNSRHLLPQPQRTRRGSPTPTRT